MEMTIDDVLAEYNAWKITISENVSPDCVDALDMAIDIMRKYQKIQKTYERFQQDDDYHTVMAWLDVMAVIGDGDAE